MLPAITYEITERSGGAEQQTDGPKQKLINERY
jgi:hypothetical protein